MFVVKVTDTIFLTILGNTMYKIYNYLYHPMLNINGVSKSRSEKVNLHIDYYIMFHNSNLFEFTPYLEDSDIVLTSGGILLEANDPDWCRSGRSFRERPNFNNDSIWNQLKEARSINNDFNPILLIVDSNFHLQENHAPEIQFIRTIDALKKLTDVPFRKVLATHCNAWVDRHQLLTQPLPTYLSESHNITQEEYESLADTLRENFLYTDYLFDRSYAVHYDFNLMQRLFRTVVFRSHWWDGKTKNFDINKFLLCQDNEIINPDLVTDTCRYTHHDGPEMRAYLLPNGGYYPYNTHQGFKYNYCETDCSTIKNDGVKIFVSPSRTGYWIDDGTEQYGSRGFIRRKLINVLQKYIGYIGDEARGNRLFSNTSLELTDSEVLGLDSQGFSPPHNAYYNSSSISFYTETLIYNNSTSPVMSATEKTWTPILKGHFILPYGPPGFCDFLKEEYDIRFPDFLDLSYDSRPPKYDTKERFETYLREVERICEMGGTRLYILKNEYRDLLIHNRDVFRKNGYKDHFSEYFLSDLKNLQENQ